MGRKLTISFHSKDKIGISFHENVSNPAVPLLFFIPQGVPEQFLGSYFLLSDSYFFFPSQQIVGLTTERCERIAHKGVFFFSIPPLRSPWKKKRKICFPSNFNAGRRRSYVQRCLHGSLAPTENSA